VTTTLSPSSSMMAADSRAVRFESQCELIPEPQAQSLIRKLGKSFTFPLLKPRSPEVEPDPRARTIEERFGERGSGLSPKRSRVSPSPARDDPPLVPCIVNHDSPSSPVASSSTSGFSRIPRRRASLPTPSSRADVVTIPLRPCCVACEPIWEESQKEGDQWKEKFTRGARRRRSLSSEARPIVHHRHGSFDSTHSFGHSPALTIKVDEVDKRRCSGEGRPVVVDPGSPIDLPADPERRHASDSLVPSSLSTMGRVKTPIPEDDEDQLFPLPKRSPSTSPVPSPSGSSSSLHDRGRKTSPSSSRESIPQRNRVPSPTKSDRLTSPPPPSPITKSFSVPLPPKNLSRSVPPDKPYLDSETILGPSITRSTTLSPKRSKIWSTGVSIGAGILKGVSGMSVGPGSPLA